MDKIAYYVNEIEKLAKFKKEDKKRVAYATGGLGALALAKDRILGHKTIYHGTSKSNWEGIKNEGLKADRGGVGGVTDKTNMMGEYAKDVKNNIHYTSVKPVARMYAKTSENPNAMKEGIKSMVGKGGKVVEAKIPYSQYAKSLIDNAGDSDVSNIPKWQRGMAKNMAAKTIEDIPAEAIKGSNAKFINKLKYTGKNLPGYIKSHPGRFGTGLALAGTGAYLLHKATQKSDHQDGSIGD